MISSNRIFRTLSLAGGGKFYFALTQLIQVVEKKSGTWDFLTNFRYLRQARVYKTSFSVLILHWIAKFTQLTTNRFILYFDQAQAFFKILLEMLWSYLPNNLTYTYCKGLRTKTVKMFLNDVKNASSNNFDRSLVNNCYTSI